MRRAANSGPYRLTGHVTLLTVMALGLSVFCQSGGVAAAEQETGSIPAGPNATVVGAGSAPAASASDTAPADTKASNTKASNTKASDTKASDGKATPSDPAAPVCFKLTSHCIDSNRSAEAHTGKAQPLNLNAPDVRSVVPVQELKEPLPTPEEQNAAEETNTVQVAGDSNTPDVPGGFGALWWAIRNPAQAWRIVAPVQ